jgi:hypothetical protein
LFSAVAGVAVDARRRVAETARMKMSARGVFMPSTLGRAARG